MKIDQDGNYVLSPAEAFRLREFIRVSLDRQFTAIEDKHGPTGLPWKEGMKTVNPRMHAVMEEFEQLDASTGHPFDPNEKSA